jgi:pyrimidine operon attenuation protein/uracil phosphoribosyltransferase
MGDVALDAAGIGQALTDIADQLARGKDRGPFAVVGIRRGGEHLSRRLAPLLEKRTGEKVARGVVDITLYRDDGFGPHDWPEVGVSQIGFDLSQHIVVLVDDVLYTGRTVRAAIDAILDYGRPRAVRLAVLVDRGLRELPIRPDAVGLVLDTQPGQHVDVQLTEGGAAADAVLVGPKGAGR